jgi:uncharacterized protein with HEPN domain
MKKDSVYLRHILESIEKIESYASVGNKTFMETSHWQDAVIRNLEIIGEAVKRLSEDLKNRHPVSETIPIKHQIWFSNHIWCFFILFFNLHSAL